MDNNLERFLRGEPLVRNDQLVSSETDAVSGPGKVVSEQQLGGSTDADQSTTAAVVSVADKKTIEGNKNVGAALKEGVVGVKDAMTAEVQRQGDRLKHAVHFDALRVKAGQTRDAVARVGGKVRNVAGGIGGSEVFGLLGAAGHVVTAAAEIKSGNTLKGIAAAGSSVSKLAAVGERVVTSRPTTPVAKAA